jgi:competence protein ComEC
MDDVQQKLALIDKQLTGGFTNLHKQIISTSPLVFVTAGLITGILLQSTLRLSVWLWLMLLALCAIAAITLFVIQRQKEKLPPYIIAYTAFACFACLGAIRLTSYYQPRASNIRNFVDGDRKLATIRGLIVTEPYINENQDWEFVRFKFTDPTSSFYLKMEKIKTTAGWTKASGTVRVQVDEPVLDLKVGDYIQAYCWLDRFKAPTNPGQFNTARYLARKNVFIAVSVQSREGIKLLESGSVGICTKINRKLREKATQALVGDLSLEEANRGLLEALLLGDRRDIDSVTYMAFRKTGLLHFISLSGMHLGILVGIIWWLCKTAGLMKRARATICIIAIIVFLLIVPPRAPTVRAAIIGWVFCASFFFRRHSNPVNTLSLAAIILLLIRPTDLFEAGWQLSFASVLGIIFFTGRIEFLIYEKVTDRFWSRESQIRKPFFLTIARPGKYLFRLFSVGLAAWLGGAGILLYHFYTINPFTSIWTVVAFPFVALILIIGFLKIILSLLLPSVAAVLGVIVTGLADLLILIVKFIASWDISEILIGHVPLAPIILYYCLILLAGFVYFRRPLLKKVICTVMALAIIVFLGVTKWQRTHQENLIITCLDVGHGQAILAQLPGKANVLFDAGSLHNSDIGRRVIAPFLDYKGINKIDAIIVSHDDIDHINGIPEIAECCEVGRVYANNAFFNNIDNRDPLANFLYEQLSEKGFEITNLKDLNINGAVKIKFIWPSEQISENEELDDNDKSVVALIEFAGTKILLCSDIEEFAQRELLRMYPNLKVDIVVVPHHGSPKTSEASFLKNLDADILIYSCDRRQYERQQMNKEQNKAKSFYTVRDGAITASICKDGTIRTATFARAPFLPAP